VVRRNRGFVDKFSATDDGGIRRAAPTADPAGDAILSAVEIKRALHERINPRLAEAGLPRSRRVSACMWPWW